MARSTKKPSTSPRVPIGYLVATAVVCGALIMVEEVLGSRVIGPFFGVSLFVWTSLITVTLLALAAGYAVGGWLADRHGSPDWLYGIVFLAGVAALLVPWLRGPILKACMPVGLRAGSFLSALLLFGPGLFLLGCVSPYLVKLAAREMRNIGRTVGGFYALSTLGSVAGTLFTGFFLIGALGIQRIFFLIGSLLVALAVGYALVFRRRWLAAAALVALPFFWLRSDALPPSRVMDNGTRVTTVAAEESFYGSLKVVDYSYGPLHTREMLIDGLIQGGVDVKTGASTYAYPYFLQYLPWALRPGGRSCLVVGLGAGVIPRWYAARGVVTEVVDIDPEVVRLAREYFAFPETIDVTVADARLYLSTTSKTFDYLVLDVFNGDATPGHLISREAFALMKERLNDGGLLAANFHGAIEGRTLGTASVVHTLKAVFDQVRIYPTFRVNRQNQGAGNLAIVAYDGPPRMLRPDVVPHAEVHVMAAEAVRGNWGREFTFPEGAPAVLLTDDFNPVDVLNAPVTEGIRRAVVGTTEWDVLLGSG